MEAVLIVTVVRRFV